MRMLQGADNVILDRLGESSEQREYYDLTLQHLEKFAKEGLRTLCLGFCVIPEEDYLNWNIKMNTASTSMTQRDEMVEEAASLIETNLTLIGATAIEDRLQDQVRTWIYIYIICFVKKNNVSY